MELTIFCQQCQRLRWIKRIHIAFPIVLILDCKHKIDLTTDLKFSLSQETT